MEMNYHARRLDPTLKRLFDLVAATTGLLLLSPFFVVVSIIVKAYDGGPIFHRAIRVGKDGQLFHLYKFRTMVINAERQGPVVTANSDPRITPVGRYLRRTKLDELPQLLNVLTGDMSLVGPRPEDPHYVALYTLEQRRVLDVCPGITSAASIIYRHEERMLTGRDWEDIYRNEIMPAKLAIDLNYVSCRTMWSDLGLIFRTLIAVFK